ncbi:zinc finger BED domain-containing protein RICESLEEPER 2-like [Rosa chinensis]|uniref:zinc finger BED domain-containing protein RICESLEEPER 2-like n=1 Tax=Rosa chinensis TaxID=74649 RepID=UPI000D08AC7A|nr:zinc finger BED domain-containing protein RICESLEEPER 2-like [Rosa chinensis]
MGSLSDSSHSLNCHSTHSDSEKDEAVGNDAVAICQQAKNKELEVAAAIEGVEEAPTQASCGEPKKRRRENRMKKASPRSFMWDHYEKYDITLYIEKDGKKEECGFEKRAKCRYCTADLAADSSFNAHFIDSGWNLHKRILNFCVILNHKGTTIGKLLETCLLQWRIDKVLTVSVDNASANKVATEYLQRKMAGWKNPPMFGGKFMHVRCLAHIFNIIVRAGLRIMDRGCAAIRNTVKYIRSSSNRLDCFKVCVDKETVEGHVDSQKIPALDVPMQWNSTFLMLDIALEVRPTFDRMADEEENKYKDYFDEDEEVEEEEDTEIGIQKRSVQPRKRVGPPVKADWEKAEIFVKFLRVFYDMTMRISATKHPTAHKAFHDIVAIEAEINAFFVPPEMSDGTHGSETELLMMEIAMKMRAKFRKYFGTVDDMNQLLLVALVLDPRFKLKNISHICLTHLQFDAAEAKTKANEVKELLVSLTDLYRSSTNASSKTTSSKSKEKTKKMSEKMVEILEGWQRALAESDEVVVESEVDRYLLDPMENPKDEDWQLLDWWKINGCKYPNLALVARDVLAIQM